MTILMAIGWVSLIIIGSIIADIIILLIINKLEQ